MATTRDSNTDASHYTLPSRPDVLCEDRFDLTNSDDDEVPFWSILCVLMSRRILTSSELIDVLDTITVTLRGSSLPDYELLREIVDRRASAFFSNTWPVLTKIALDMPNLFPSGRISILCKKKSSISLTRRQAACLVIHQFLCTLKPPAERHHLYDFSIWYTSEQPHQRASKIYLTSILTYFDRIADLSSILDFPDWRLEYRLVTWASHESRSTFSPLEIIRLNSPDNRPSLLGLPDGACVISANKVVGFGQSGTQEEIHVGTSPEACPIVLLTAQLGDDEVVVVRGAESVMTISGDRRNLRCEEILKPHQDPAAHQSIWQDRTMLFMDALELDLTQTVEELLPDLNTGNVQRELRKAYTAFSSGKYSHICTGLWGCGAFGGDANVKAAIQWCAASMLGVRLVFICNSPEQWRFADRLEEFVEFVVCRKISVDRVTQLLLDLKPGDAAKRRMTVLNMLQEALGAFSPR